MQCCANLSDVFYQYNPENHQLHQLDNLNTFFKPLLQDARRSSGAAKQRYTLINLAAHYGRVSLKHEGFTYLLQLKHVEIFMQQLCLVNNAR